MRGSDVFFDYLQSWSSL